MIFLSEKYLLIKGLVQENYRKFEYFQHYKNPSILILDKALNAIELDLEKQIINLIRNNFKNISLIQISHRPLEENIYNKIFDL